jgi:hypothetical protein
MSGIHNEVLDFLDAELTRTLLTEIVDIPDPEHAGASGAVIKMTDPTKVGAIKIGPLQGDPEPDEARISVEIYANDPDKELKTGLFASADAWEDQVLEVEIGGCMIWERRFTIKARCLLERTREEATQARRIASTVRSRIEKTLLKANFGSVHSEDETVIRGAFSADLNSETIQSGGPPDAFDYLIKIRFSILTSEQI